jgi:hypothetical protein
VLAVYSADLPELEAARNIVLEGVHVQQDLRFLGSYNGAAGKYAAALNLTHFAAESEAYTVGGRVSPYPFIAPGAKGMANFIKGAYENPDEPVFSEQEFPQQ